MNTVKITFGNQEFSIKQTFRALMLFEEMTKKSAERIEENLNDVLTLFYCILKAGNRETFNYSFDEFIDVLDNNQDSLQIFTNYLQEQAAQVNQPKKKVVKKG